MSFFCNFWTTVQDLHKLKRLKIKMGPHLNFPEFKVYTKIIPPTLIALLLSLLILQQFLYHQTNPGMFWLFRAENLRKGLDLILVCYLIWRLITRGEQAIFNLRIKKKRRSSIDLDIHHSKVFSSESWSLIFLHFENWWSY